LMLSAWAIAIVHGAHKEGCPPASGESRSELWLVRPLFEPRCDNETTIMTEYKILAKQA